MRIVCIIYKWEFDKGKTMKTVVLTMPEPTLSDCILDSIHILDVTNEIELYIKKVYMPVFNNG